MRIEKLCDLIDQGAMLANAGTQAKQDYADLMVNLGLGFIKIQFQDLAATLARDWGGAVFRVSADTLQIAGTAAVLERVQADGTGQLRARERRIRWKDGGAGWEDVDVTGTWPLEGLPPAAWFRELCRESVQWSLCMHCASLLDTTAEKVAQFGRFSYYGSSPGTRAFNAVETSLCHRLGLRSYQGWDGAWEAANTAYKTFLAGLDRDAFRIARKCEGKKASLATYNLVAANLPVLKQLTRESPSLLPLLYQALKAGEITGLSEAAFRDLKAALKTRGISQAVWRQLGAMKIAESRKLLVRYGLSDTLQIVRMLAETGEAVPQPVLSHWLMAWMPQHYSWGATCRLRHKHFLPPAWVRRAVARHVTALKLDRERMKRFLDREYSDVLDWLVAQEVSPDANQVRAGWCWIVRQSQAWHDKVARQRARNDYSWTSVLSAFRDGPYDVVPLTSSQDLSAEGARMHHCVGTYDRQCVAGTSRIFSYRENGRPVATVELRRDGENWKIAQARGACNTAVPADVEARIKGLEGRYNSAYRKFLSHDAI